MNQRLSAFIREKEHSETEWLSQLASQAGVLLPGQSLVVKIEVREGPVTYGARNRSRFYNRPITAEEYGRALDLHLADPDRRVLEFLRANNGGPVHSSQLALAVGKAKFFSDNVQHLNYALGKLRPPLRVVTTARGRRTEDSYWRIAEVVKA